MDHNRYGYSGEGFTRPPPGYPGYHSQYFPTYNQQYNPYYAHQYAPAFDARYAFRTPPPQFQQQRVYEPANTAGSEGRIAVNNSNCGNATTSNVGNTTMTNCNSNNNNRHGNHRVENHGHMQVHNNSEHRTTRVGDVSSNGGNARANANREDFMRNAKIRGGTNNNSGYQYGGGGGSVNIGRGD